MSRLGGYVYHLTDGAGAGAFLVCFTTVGVGLLAGAATVTGADIAKITAASAVTTMFMSAAALDFAGPIMDTTERSSHSIPLKHQKTCRKIGAGLLLSFSLACSAGTGYFVHQSLSNQNAPALN